MLSLGQKLIALGALAVLLLPVVLFMPWWLSVLALFAAIPFAFAVLVKL